MSMTSTYSVSFESKCWYRTGLVTPAAAAISSIDVAWKPFWVNTLVASSSSCVRRCARGIRDVDTALTSGGWEGRYDIGPAPADRKSTRLNSSHVALSYAVVCLTT